MIFGQVLLCPSILMIAGVNVFTWSQVRPSKLSIDKMVKERLDAFFEQINSYYAQRTDQGVRWNSITRNYWLEIHMDKDRRVPEKKWHSDLADFQLRVQANLDAIMTFANVTSRGKNLMLRDLERMCKYAHGVNNCEASDVEYSPEGGSQIVE